MSDKERIPPGQYATRNFPVLSAGPTPQIELDQWELKVFGEVKEPLTFSWQEFLQLPQEKVLTDIHCVTRWSKLDTEWQGVPFRVLHEKAGVKPEAKWVLIHAAPDYTTNVPLQDLLQEKVLLAHRYDGEPLSPDHGFPVRLVVPHLYFWKSAKWVTGLEFLTEDQPGFWEQNGYHNYGDPWKEQRFSF